MFSIPADCTVVADPTKFQTLGDCPSSIQDGGECTMGCAPGYELADPTAIQKLYCDGAALYDGVDYNEWQGFTCKKSMSDSRNEIDDDREMNEFGLRSNENGFP